MHINWEVIPALVIILTPMVHVICTGYILPECIRDWLEDNFVGYHPTNYYDR